MPLPILLQLMGLTHNNNNNSYNNCNYGSTIVPNWELVGQRLLSHPEEALLNAAYDDTNIPFSSPLYIALRNELTPIPVEILRILLLANPAALTDETLDMACRNLYTSTEVMNVLLDARPDYSYAVTISTTAAARRTTTTIQNDNNARHGNIPGGVGVRRGGYHSWHPPLHIAAKRGRSVEAVGALLERNGWEALWVRDCCSRIPLHEACAEGSPKVLRLILEEGFRSSAINKGRAVTAGAGGIFERDLLGLTPLECAMLKSKHLEDCYAKDIKSGGGQGGSGSAYYHGNDFREKRMDAWKRLVLCVQAAAAAIRHDSSNDVHNLSFVDKIFDTPFLQAAVEFVAWGGLDLRSDDLFHLLLHTGHCDSKAAASTIDKSGRLPFHLAEEQGLTFSNGLMQILQAHPEALFGKDIDSRIVPQMITALGGNFGLGMIFTMVTNAPSFFDYHRNQQFNLKDRNKITCSSQCNEGGFDDDNCLYGDNEGQKV